MTPSRKLFGATAFTVALAGGGVAGVVLGAPSLSAAQVGTTTQPSADAHHWGPGPDGGAGLDVAAKALGMSHDELLAALRGGQSIADVAKAQGVDVPKVIDALTADATTRLEGAITSLPDRITQMVNHKGLPNFGDRRGRDGRRGRHGFRPGLDVAASTIGITEAELVTAIRGGSSIADVAVAHHLDAQTVIDALVAKAGDRIDQEVTAGDLTKAEATARKVAVSATITAIVNHKGPAGPSAGDPHPDSVPSNA